MDQRLKKITVCSWAMLTLLAIPSVKAQVPNYSQPAGCQSCGLLHPAEPCPGACQTPIRAVDCAANCGREGRWPELSPSDFQSYGQGEYAGPARLAHLRNYRLRPNDELQVVYVVSRRLSNGDYRLMIGDSVMISLIGDAELNQGTLERGLEIQPDGFIHADALKKPVFAAGLTVSQLREVLEERYLELYNEPAVSVKPVKTSTLADDIRNAVGGASGLQQQALQIRVAPDGTIRLPWIGAVNVQGLTLNDVKQEINARYSASGAGLVVEPILAQQADHFVYVMGRVGQAGQIQLQGPTTVSMAIAAAGGWEAEGNLRQVVVFRRADDWRLISTMLDLRGAYYGKRPTPSDEIWLRDGDVVIVPPTPITVFDDFVRQVFTEGVYAVVPFQGIAINLGQQQ